MSSEGRWLVGLWLLTITLALLPALVAVVTGSAFDPMCLACGGVPFIPLIGERVGRLFGSPQAPKPAVEDLLATSVSEDDSADQDEE